jgi:protein-S-isoprenylcysteine O-methyltransferase Ste14
VQTGFFAALLLIPAGTWHWPRAIQYLVIFGLYALVASIVFALYAPASLEARVKLSAAKHQPKADRIASLFLFLLLAGWFVFIPIDVFRLQLFPLAPLWVLALGAALLVCGSGMMFVALWQNAFAAPIVVDQSERGQTLVDKGLYSHIRHPMYLGILLFFVGTGLWFQSYASVIAVPIAFAPIIARVLVEEKTLRETLDGYAAYTERVRYRLVPRIW